MRAGSPILIMAGTLTVAATFGCQPPKPEPTFTQEEVAQMQAILRSREFTPGAIRLIKAEAARLQPENYRLVLPTFGPGTSIVGSETIGKLPVTEVKRLASQRKLEYAENSNAQAIIFQNAEQGGNPGGGAGGGGSAGCQGDHSTPAHGHDIAARIEEILRNINQSKYVFLY